MDELEDAALLHGSGIKKPSRSGWIIAIVLGQFIALLITTTAVAQGSLTANLDVSLPATSNALTYTTLALIYSVPHLFCRRPSSGSPSSNSSSEVSPVIIQGIPVPTSSPTSSSRGSSPPPVHPTSSLRALGLSLTTPRPAYSDNWHLSPWIYAVIGLVDVQANFLVIQAYSYTSLQYVILLSCASIPVIMALSKTILDVPYKSKHYAAAAIAVLGIAVLVSTQEKEPSMTQDTNETTRTLDSTNDDVTRSQHEGDDPEPSGIGNALFGDLLVLLGASLYGTSNLCQEVALKYHVARPEYLAGLSLFGAGISMIQWALTEAPVLVSGEIALTWAIVFYLVLFVVALTTVYAVTPVLLSISSATLLNLSFLMANVYSLAAGVVLFGATLHAGLVVGFCLILLALVLYNLDSPDLPARPSST